ncbi:AI-2E family transporter [bacterium]|nr:MAG: AI-2E family transporter [bacterium]
MDDLLSTERGLRYLRIISIMLTIIGLKVVGEMLFAGKSLILPFALALFLSFILGPIIDFLEKKRIPRWLAILIPILLTGFVFFFLGMLIKSNVQSFVIEFPKYETRTKALYENVLSLLNIPTDVFTGSPKSWIDDPRLSQYLENFSLTNTISGILGALSNLLSNALLVLLFLMFLLSGRNQLIIKLQKAFKEETANQITSIVKNINSQVQKYIIAKTIISIVTAILVMIVLYSFGVEFALIWGILTFLLNFIPNVGSIIATLLPLTIAVIQFDSFVPIIWIGGILMAIQTVVGNVIDPKYIGKSINLSALVVLLSLIFWGWLWGIIGMFLSVPIMVIIKIILENIPELKFMSTLMSAEKPE